MGFSILQLIMINVVLDALKNVSLQSKGELLAFRLVYCNIN